MDITLKIRFFSFLLPRKIYLHQIFHHTDKHVFTGHKYIFTNNLHETQNIYLKHIFYIFSNNLLHPSNFESISTKLN